MLIHAPKLELEEGETIKLMGFSIYKNNPCKFVINEIETEGKTIYFTAGSSGKQQILFYAQDDKGEWVSDSLVLTIAKSEFKKLDWRSVLK